MRVRVFMIHFFEFLMVMMVFAVREVEMLEGSERKEMNGGYDLNEETIRAENALREVEILEGSERKEMNGGYDLNEETIRAQNALQYNWYPDPLQYMNSYQSWNGFDGFWQNGVVLEAIANVRAYTESTKCDKVVHSGLRSVEELSIAYPPEPSYDDMAWYGLAYARIHEVYNFTNVNKFLETSMQIFNWNWQRGWDTNRTGDCIGGFWFDNSNVFKGTITNVLMIQLGAKLYRLTGNSSFLERANITYDFVKRTGLIDANTGIVYDSVDLSTCHANVDDTIWTYTQGITLAGLTELNRTNESKHLADGTLRRFVKDDILTEISCENVTSSTCNEDQLLFKGIFVRSLQYLINALPENSLDRTRYSTFIKDQNFIIFY